MAVLPGIGALDELRVAPQLRHLNVQQLLRAIGAGVAAVDGNRVVPLMAGGVANTSPIFTLTPKVGAAKITAANTNSDGTGNITTPTIFVAFTAGANGSFVTRLRFNLVATAAGTATTATVGRVFYSTVSSGATTGGTDTWLLSEVTLPSVTADSASAPTNPIEVMLNMPIPTGATILVSTHAAPAASTSVQALCFGGDY